MTRARDHRTPRRAEGPPRQLGAAASLHSAEGLLAASVVIDAHDPAVADLEHHEDLPVQKRDLAKSWPRDADHDALAGRVELEVLDAGIAAVEGGAHAVNNRAPSVAQELGQNPLVDHVGIEAGGDGVDVSAAPGVEVVKDRRHRCVGHLDLLHHRLRLSRSTSIEPRRANESEQKGPTVHHGD